MLSESQKIVLIAIWPGEPAAGLFAGSETITLNLEGGGWGEDFIEGLEEAMKQTLTEHFDNGTKILTEKEYKKLCDEEDKIDKSFFGE